MLNLFNHLPRILVTFLQSVPTPHLTPVVVDNLIDIPRLSSLHLILSDTIELVNSFFVLIYTLSNKIVLHLVPDNLIDIPRLRSLHLILSDTIELVNSFFYNLIDIPRLSSLHLMLSDTIELVNSFFCIQMVIIYTMYVYRLVMNAIVYQILGLYQTIHSRKWRKGVETVKMMG
ncbi:hypothetical protein J6590_082368 [Homalodisca vitripennis]|nr:hypothetical protein J6590_082368 [Homalodisca vitripennis]